MWEKRLQFILAFILTLTCIPLPASAGFFSKGDPHKRIAIVLDNSDSMIVQSSELPYLTRWAEATYALRTLLNMINSRDEVALYTVASDQKAEDGSDRVTISEDVTRDNIDQNLSRMGISAVTKTYGLERAYEWAANASASTENWVVILSDGEFYGEDAKKGPLLYEESVGERARLGYLVGIHTLFIGMDMPNEDLQMLRDKYGCDGYNTFIGTGTGGGRIEEAILDISEKIYGMKELNFSSATLSGYPEFHYENGNLIWETEPGLSSYLNRVIIIAQMENAGQPTAPADGRMRLVHSDSSFSWCSPGDLESVLQEHDARTKTKKYNLLPAATFQRKIAETFLNKCCYVRTYEASEIGNFISFQTPQGNYAYRIYYELKEDIVPELLVTQNGNEISSGQDGIYSILEGETCLEYRLMSGKEEIPQTLIAIQPEEKHLLIDGTEASEAEAAQWEFVHGSPGHNSHVVEAVFRGRRTENTVQVSLDMKKYSLTIPAGQEIHIDDPEGAVLVAETNLPLEWVDANLRECLHDGLAGTRDIHAALDLTELDWESENDRIWIYVPISVSSSSRLDISADIPVQIAIDGMGPEDNFLQTISTVRARQSIPETSLKPAPKKPKIALPFWPRSVAFIHGTVGTKDVTSELVLENASVTGLENLEDIKWKFDGKTLGIKYDGSWSDTISLLSHGIMGGKVVLEGTLYRNGEVVEENFRREGAVSWAGTISEVIIVILVVLSVLIFCSTVLIMAISGRSMFAECVCQLCGGLRKETFPIYWKWQKITPSVAPLRWLPLFMSISFSMCKELPQAAREYRIRLCGTRRGYKLHEKSIANLPAEIIFVGNGGQPAVLEMAGDSLEFRVQNGQSCILSCRKERNLSMELGMAILFCVLVLAGTGVLYGITSGVWYHFL